MGSIYVIILGAGKTISWPFHVDRFGGFGDFLVGECQALLNPIYQWMGYQVNPDIEQVGGSADTVREALYEALERAWTMIPQSLLLGLGRTVTLKVYSGPLPQR